MKMRFRPSFFPFTEPSLEVDIQCRRDKGEVRFGEGDDWMEILGCGMVHPNVLRNCGLDPDEYQGFAWGMGIDRIAMLKYGMPDLRAFFEADVRWLSPLRLPPARCADAGGGIEFVSTRRNCHRHHRCSTRRSMLTCGRLRCRMDAQVATPGLTVNCAETAGAFSDHDEIHPLLAQGASRHRPLARRDRRQAHHDRARGRGRRRTRRSAWRLRHRARGRGQAASERRPAARLHGRYRRGRADAGRVRRAQCAHRHEGRVRAARHLHPGKDMHARRRHHPRRREPRHAGLRAELQLSDDHEGIIDLPDDAPVGARYANGPASTIP